MMLIPLAFILIISVLNIFKHPFIIYLPFKIPGKQMAITLPPFGIFIESELKRYDSRDPCKHPLMHENHATVGNVNLFTELRSNFLWEDVVILLELTYIMRVKINITNKRICNITKYW